MKFFIPFLAAFLIFSSILPSCNKSPDTPTPPIVDSATIMGFKDSTLLVKSFSITYYDASGNISDSLPTLYLFYDTLQKNVYFTAQPAISLPITNFFLKLSYNNNGLLSHVTSNLGSGDADDVATVDYSYDDKNVIKSEMATFVNGETLVNSFNKAGTSSGGYRLSFNGWGNANSVTDSSSYSQTFGADGNLLSLSEFYLPSLKESYVDTVLYDANGNINKVVETHFQDDGNSTSYTTIEFNSRDTKGDQLYNLNKVLSNGIANLPNAGLISLGSIFSGNDNIFFYQFTKFPSLSTKVYLGDTNSYQTFNPNPQYDNKERLVTYKMFYGEDPDYYAEYGLSYYK